jgi:hypothetical protein
MAAHVQTDRSVVQSIANPKDIASMTAEYTSAGLRELPLLASRYADRNAVANGMATTVISSRLRHSTLRSTRPTSSNTPWSLTMPKPDRFLDPVLSQSRVERNKQQRA